MKLGRAASGTARALAIASVAVIITLSGLAGCARFARDGHEAHGRRASDTAVVLLVDGKTTQLVTVDLARKQVVKRKELRSLALSVARDAKTGASVTAQCGGADRDADDVAGVSTGPQGSVRYVGLRVPNPLQAVAADGQAYLLHGFEQPQGMVVTSFDIASRSVHPIRHVPSDTTFLLGKGDQVFIFANARGAAIPRSRVSRLEDGPAISEGPAVSHVATLSAAIIAATPARQGFTALGMRSSSDPRADTSILQFSPDFKIEREARVLGLSAGATDIAATDRSIAVADSSIEDPAHTVGRILFYDARSLEKRSEMDMGGAPIAVARAGDRLLVVDGPKGELLVFGADPTRPESRIRLGARGTITVDLADVD